MKLTDATAQSVDLVIIGGGPAGSAAAITAARLGARVAIFEARDFPRHKVCGEFVSGESLELLRHLLGAAAAGVLLDGAPVIGSTRLLFGERVLETAVPPGGVSISRYALDAQLWSAAQRAGADAVANCEVRDVRGDGPFLLSTSAGDYQAKAVIVAAGRWSNFESERSLPPGPKWIGLKAHFHEQAPPASTDLYFFEHGYCGVQPVGDGVINVSAVVRSDRATTLTEVLALHPQLRRRSRHWEKATKVLTTAPLLHRRPRPVRGNLMFAGDAAAFLDPFAGDGISIALRGGRMAADFACEFLAGKCGLEDSVASYRRQYQAEFASIIASAARFRALLPLPRPVKSVIFELLRLPGVMPYMIRKTRRAA